MRNPRARALPSHTSSRVSDDVQDAREVRAHARASAPDVLAPRVRAREAHRRRERRPGERARAGRLGDGDGDGAARVRRARATERATERARCVRASVVDERAGALEWPSRDRLAGTLGDGDVGGEATLCGWIDKSRDMGGISFADVRDHSGIAQIVASEEASEEVRETFGNLRPEARRAKGTVRARKSVNKRQRRARWSSW